MTNNDPSFVDKDTQRRLPGHRGTLFSLAPGLVEAQLESVARGSGGRSGGLHCHLTDILCASRRWRGRFLPVTVTMVDEALLLPPSGTNVACHTPFGITRIMVDLRKRLHHTIISAM